MSLYEKVLLHYLTPELNARVDDGLYGEVLCALLRSRDQQPDWDDLVFHLQQVFHIDNDKHALLLQGARQKEAPPIVLNLEVVEAKGLKGKNVNGLSDPFCTLFVSSAQQQQHNTSMKPSTLDPVWKEHFSFPVTSVEVESLNIEVWSYDYGESFADKMKRVGEVKSARGVKLFMKKITLVKQSHEFFGCVKIPLNSIPSKGIDKWYGLESRNKNGHQKKGDVHLRVALGIEKNKKVATQEYRHVFHLLILYEKEKNGETHLWEGCFAEYSEFILQQLELTGGLTPTDVDIAKWLVYIKVHCEYPLNASVFPPLVKLIIQYIKDQVIGEDDIKNIWLATETLVENFATFFKNIHKASLLNENRATQVDHMLQSLQLILSYFKGRRDAHKELDGNMSVEFVIKKTENAIFRGADQLFSGVLQQQFLEKLSVENIIKIGQTLINELKTGLEMLQPLFKEYVIRVTHVIIPATCHINRIISKTIGSSISGYISYTSTTPSATKYHNLVKPFVEEKCIASNQLESEDENGFFVIPDFTVMTNLLNLYLVVKRFADLSSELSCMGPLFIRGSFHHWFQSSVQWLDIAHYKAIDQIKKAVESDSLKPEGDVEKFTSSASDTANIFNRVQIFWSQLAWPEIDDSCTFITKILDDLCRCTIYYAEIMCSKVDRMKPSLKEKYEIPEELCFAINSIECVGMEMNRISEKELVRGIITKLEEIEGQSVAKQCERKLAAVTEDAAGNVDRKIIEVLENVGNKIRPVILNLLLIESETPSKESFMDPLIQYLDKNLVMLKHNLSPPNFDKIFVVLWKAALSALRELIETIAKNKEPSSFFKQIRKMLQILVEFFYPKGASKMDSVYKTSIHEIEQLIGLYCATTEELIMKYYQYRHDAQIHESNRTSDLGSLTVRAEYCEEIHTLRIEIANANGLKPHDSKRQCHPYVQLRLVPHTTFHMTPKFKTKTKSRTLFPLFDEIISIPLSPVAMSVGGMILFILKDSHFFGWNDFLGECFLQLESVPFTKTGTNLQNLDQVVLSITKPNDPNFVTLKILENRKTDHFAEDFVKDERKKFLATQQLLCC